VLGAVRLYLDRAKQLQDPALISLAQALLGHLPRKDVMDVFLAIQDAARACGHF
jgi:hypothetical protein